MFHGRPAAARALVTSSVHCLSVTGRTVTELLPIVVSLGVVQQIRPRMTMPCRRHVTAKEGADATRLADPNAKSPETMAGNQSRILVGKRTQAREPSSI